MKGNKHNTHTLAENKLLCLTSRLLRLEEAIHSSIITQLADDVRILGEVGQYEAMKYSES